MHISLHLDDDVIPWELKNRGDFFSKFFWDSRLQYEFWQNKRKLMRKIPWNCLAYSLMVWGLVALETQGSRSTAPMLHILAQNPTKFWATISAHCPSVGVIKEQPK